jgi:membrane associated rhomboid family serine protease
MLFWQLLPTSHRILLLLGATYFVNIALRGMLTQWLALMPFTSVGAGQYWRFLTYPLASTGFWEMLSTSAVFYFFAPEVERIISARRLLLVLGIFIVVHAVVFAPLLMLTNATLAGTSAISLFVLTMYVYLYPSGEVSLFGIIPMRATMLLCLMFVVAIVSSVMSFSLNPAAIAHAFANEGFGIFFGFLFSHLYFGRLSSGGFVLLKRQPKQQAPTRRASTPSPASVAGRSSSAQLDESERRILPIHSEDDELAPLDEDRLNEILDKISAKGQASLTGEEQRFLKDYATRL